MYRFALRPRWLVSHLVVLLLVATMIGLGLWQLRRLDQRQATNAIVAERTADAAVPVDELLTPSTTEAEVDAVEFRRVTAGGEWQGDEQVLVRGRSLDEAPGSWVLTPLLLADGTRLVVNRGWIPNDGTLVAVPEVIAPPPGPVRVTGLVQATQEREGIGATDPAEGRLTDLARVDVDRLAAQLDGPVLPAWVQLTEQDPTPAEAATPRVLPLPALDEGPHFSYAIQWFTFTVIALVGYPLILRRNGREHAAEAAAVRRAAAAPPPDPEADPADPAVEAPSPSGAGSSAPIPH